MKRFAFSLERLLSYKRQVFDAERAILGDMHAALARFTAELREIKAETRRRADELAELSARGTSVVEMQRHKNYLRRLDEAAWEKNRQITLQRQAIEVQTEKVREAKIEISTIENLRERKLEEYRYAENKEQELFIEEFVSFQRSVVNG